MILAGLIIVHIVLLLNLNFTAWPEIFSFPYFFNNGFNLYKDMVHPYTPLLTMCLAYLYKIFGYNILVVKIFTYFLILVNDLLIFKITLKFTKNNRWGIFAVIFYVLTQSFLDGNQLWFDFVISTPILVSLWFVINKKYFWSGVAFAIAFLIKQNSLLFLLLALMFTHKIKNLFKLLLGAFLPIVPLIIYLYLSNSLTDFFNWVLIYPSKYWTSFPNYVQLIPSNKQLLIFIIIFLPAIYLAFKNKTKEYVMLLGSLIISTILIYPRFSFFHFQTGIAILAIIFGIASSNFPKKYYLHLYLIILTLLLPKNWGNSARFIDDNKLSVEKSAIIYLLGPHSLNYVINNSLPPKPWIDNYGWYFEIPGIQQKVINSWKIDPPKFVYVSKPGQGNWYDLGTYQPKEVVKYIKENYIKVDELNSVEVWKLK